MPYKIAKVSGGYKVTNRITGKSYSKKPLSRSRAVKQLRAIAMHTRGR